MTKFFLNRVVKHTECPRQELTLHNECIRFMTAAGWKLVRHEWQVVKGANEHGVGDLVFSKKNVDCVIECKRSTVPKVFEQARYYGAAWKLLYATKQKNVMYGVWTCNTKSITGILQSNKDAREICERDICNYLWVHQRK